MANRPLIKPLGMREPAVVEQLGSAVLYRAMRQDGWLTPIIHRHKMMIFDSGHVAQCWARVVSGELPKSLQREEATA